MPALGSGGHLGVFSPAEKAAVQGQRHRALSVFRTLERGLECGVWSEERAGDEMRRGQERDLRGLPPG